PYEKGLYGHSDADVLIHAIIDALLGAIAEGDIGKAFPDTDPQYLGCDSRQLLQDIMSRVKEKGFRIGNLDTTICAQEPKLRPYIDEMRKVLAHDLETDIENISVKATTEEGMGITGSGMGMTAQAVVLLSKD
ncbi:MAG TPA: 2-C-methyl-D-erythritol 2,4-cyclodiphosphate synthase, partial [Candidatus Cloacimonadota bacterium]|nr:2-C-methyl-D-erythritol 2,4-cyclodiphosphate synthase [Candidatus Cloacimonadota bacterium]